MRFDKETITTVPGKYAGSRNDKIFGRLDCPSGERQLHPKNRIFFRDWEDAIKTGYRPCKVCKPEMPRLNEELSCFHPALDELHVAIWETGVTPYEDPSTCFYVALNWIQKDSRNDRDLASHQINLEEGGFLHPSAITRALMWGERLGLFVIDHSLLPDDLVRYVPANPASPKQLRARESAFRSRPTTSITVDSMGRTLNVTTSIRSPITNPPL